MQDTPIYLRLFAGGLLGQATAIAATTLLGGGLIAQIAIAASIATIITLQPLLDVIGRGIKAAWQRSDGFEPSLAPFPPENETSDHASVRRALSARKAMQLPWYLRAAAGTLLATINSGLAPFIGLASITYAILVVSIATSFVIIPPIAARAPSAWKIRGKFREGIAACARRSLSSAPKGTGEFQELAEKEAKAAAKNVTETGPVPARRRQRGVRVWSELRSEDEDKAEAPSNADAPQPTDPGFMA